MKHRISRRAFLNGCTLLAAAAAVSSLTSCGEKEAKDSGLAQIVVGSDSYPPYIYLNNDGVPTGIDVEIATEAFRRMGYAARFETINWEQICSLYISLYKCCKASVIPLQNNYLHEQKIIQLT